VLQRILQRFCEVVLGHLQVVLRSNRFRVPDPVTHHLNWKIVSDLGLAGDPSISTGTTGGGKVKGLLIDVSDDVVVSGGSGWMVMFWPLTFSSPLLP
jgi:hypothetical protein